MATSAIGTSPSRWAQTPSIIQQVEHHPAFHSLSNEDAANKILQQAAPFTYILWKDDQNQRYFLSFMNPSLEMEHRFFSRNSKDLWFYQNADPHTAPSVTLLIPIIMHCKPEQCHMLRQV